MMSYPNLPARLLPNEPCLWTATETVKQIARGAITVESYAKALLDRSRRRDDVVKAWQHLDDNLIIREARRLDNIPLEERGRLHGVAIGIKDVIDTKDMPTEYGSMFYKDYQPRSDASVVAILRAHGALIFGKTTTTEFTLANNGPATTNPHDSKRTPGGSSCGSAAAVADFHVPVAFGTQLGGSVIRPASYCGIWAFKPTWGALPMSGVKVVSPSFDTLGYFARSLEDILLITSVFDLKDDVEIVETPLRKSSIAFVRGPSWCKAGPSTIAAMTTTARVLQHRCPDIADIPDDIRFIIADQHLRRLSLAEIGQNLLVEYTEHQTGRRSAEATIGSEILEWIEKSRKCKNYDRIWSYSKLPQVREDIENDILYKKDHFTLIITPSAPDVAPGGIEDMGSPCFNSVWSALHFPVLHVPAFTGANGMPIGVSLVLGRYQDQQLLKTGELIGGRLMRVGRWNPSSPSLFRHKEASIEEQLGKLST